MSGGHRELRNLKEKTLSFQSKETLGPGCCLQISGWPTVNLQIPGEPPEADFSTAEVRHSIFDTLASMETSEGDVDKAFITVVECSIEAMTDLH